MAKYKTIDCSQCKQKSRATNTQVQDVIQFVLIIFGLIPGIIYWFVSKGKACYICGVKNS
ncbi:MAG: hypothetical protein ACRC1F_00750 [Metamycoplasmataceae bacterium]